MTLHNGRTIENFKVPLYFDQKICITSDCEINDAELKAFHDVLQLVDQLTRIDPPTAPLLSLNVFFIAGNSSCFTEDEPLALGSFEQNIIYMLGKWRSLNFSLIQMQFAMTEELIHAVWQIPDGVLLERKVETIFRLGGMDIDYTEFRSMLLS